MRLTRPKIVTFWLAVVLAILGVIGSLGTVPALSAYAFWLVVVAFIILALGNMVKNL